MWLIWIKPLSVCYNVNRAFSHGCKLIIPFANCRRHIAYRSFQVLPAISSTRAGSSLHDGITRHRLRLITDLGFNILFHCICYFAVISTAYLLSFFIKQAAPGNLKASSHCARWHYFFIKWIKICICSHNRFHGTADLWNTSFILLSTIWLFILSSRRLSDCLYTMLVGWRWRHDFHR